MKIILIFIYTLSAIKLFSQTHEIQIELVGISTGVSLNYIYTDKKEKINFQIGCGYYPILFDPDYKSLTIPMAINSVNTKKNYQWEYGVGITTAISLSKEFHYNTFIPFILTNIAYKYNNPQDRITFKFSINPSIIVSGYSKSPNLFPFIGMYLGYKLNKPRTKI